MPRGVRGLRGSSSRGTPFALLFHKRAFQVYPFFVSVVSGTWHTPLFVEYSQLVGVGLVIKNLIQTVVSRSVGSFDSSRNTYTDIHPC